MTTAAPTPPIAQLQCETDTGIATIPLTQEPSFRSCSK